MKKVAIVTAASKGMGLAIAERLAKEGYELGIMARGEEVHEVADRLGAKSFQGSVAEPDDLLNLVESVRGEFGRIDALVNNTGHAAKGELLELTDEQWTEGLDLLLMNVIRMSRLVTPVFQKQGGGTIVNISTFGAVEPAINFPVSSVMRAALGSFSKQYVETYGADCIRMNNVLPGFIDSYAANDEVISNIPLQRQGTTHEVAGVVEFLLSDESSYVNGQSLLVDGGLVKGL